MTPEAPEDPIERKILKETRDAHEKFRSSDFENLVRARSEAVPAPLSSGKPGPVATLAWAGASAALLAGIILASLAIRLKPVPPRIHPIEAVLRSAALPEDAARTGTDICPGDEASSRVPLARLMLEIHEAADARTEAKDAASVPPNAGPTRSPAETYRILIFDKSIERVLVRMTS
jgi:hypothetical protein